MRQFVTPIFCGCGNTSAFEVEGLKDRLDSAISTLGGMQQSGGMGYPPDSEYEEELAANHIKNVIEDVAAALGYNIEFKGQIPHGSGRNMSKDDPANQYVVKAYNRYKQLWTVLNEFHWGGSKGHMPLDLAGRLPDSSPRMDKATAEMLYRHLTKDGTINTLDKPGSNDICYAIFPCDSIDRPKHEESFEVKILIEGNKAEKIKTSELKKLVARAINNYMESELDAGGDGEGIFSEFNPDVFNYDIEVKEAQNAQDKHCKT